MKNTLLRLAALAIALTVLAGCGSSDSDTTSDAPAAEASSTARFPATVEHKYGTTVVEREPKRIAVVGVSEQDTVLALGYTPIATTEWYGEQPSAVWPWAQPLLGDSKPTVLSTADGFDLEKIASLRPDLIIGVNAGVKRADYEKLSRIAPTIAPGKGSTEYFSPWDQQVRLIAAALGKPDEGDALIQRVKDTFAKAAAEHPEFKGKTVTFAQNGFYSGLLYVYPKGLGTEFLEYLGFEINPKVTRLPHAAGEQATVSQERLDVIDADAIVFATEKASDIAALRKVPTFRFLDAVSGHRAVFTDPILSGAMYFLTPVSLEYVAEHLTPELARAVAGKAPQRLVGGPGE
jgi:iron complex transport system substrate-binding protein